MRQATSVSDRVWLDGLLMCGSYQLLQGGSRQQKQDCYRVDMIKKLDLSIPKSSDQPSVCG